MLIMSSQEEPRELRESAVRELAALEAMLASEYDTRANSEFARKINELLANDGRTQEVLSTKLSLSEKADFMAGYLAAEGSPSTLHNLQALRQMVNEPTNEYLEHIMEGTNTGSNIRDTSSPLRGTGFSLDGLGSSAVAAHNAALNALRQLAEVYRAKALDFHDASKRAMEADLKQLDGTGIARGMRAIAQINEFGAEEVAKCISQFERIQSDQNLTVQKFAEVYGSATGILSGIAVTVKQESEKLPGSIWFWHPDKKTMGEILAPVVNGKSLDPWTTIFMYQMEALFKLMPKA